MSRHLTVKSQILANLTLYLIYDWDHNNSTSLYNLVRFPVEAVPDESLEPTFFLISTL
jgi:hypothetical protein